jgi:acyl CoA:acetate/3-ketoacid CoA transferase alpha subunit
MLKGEQHPNHKLTDGQVEMIRALWKMGHRNLKVIASNNGVSTTNIRKIINREIWTHI